MRAVWRVWFCWLAQESAGCGVHQCLMFQLDVSCFFLDVLSPNGIDEDKL